MGLGALWWKYKKQRDYGELSHNLSSFNTMSSEKCFLTAWVMVSDVCLASYLTGNRVSANKMFKSPSVSHERRITEVNTCDKCCPDRNRCILVLLFAVWSFVIVWGWVPNNLKLSHHWWEVLQNFTALFENTDLAKTHLHYVGKFSPWCQ